MQFRSSNTAGFVHFGGEIVAGAQDGNGIAIGSASTGTSPVLRAVGDDTACNLVLQGASTAAGSGVQIGTNSTSPINAIERYYIQFTPPALAASTFASSTYTAAGLTTNAVLAFTPAGAIAGSYSIRATCSTANELRLYFQNIGGSTIGTGESTQHGTLLSFRF